MTIKEHKGDLMDLNFVYLGDGKNNMAHSYLLGCGIAEMNIQIVSPKKYWPDEYFVNEAKKFGINVDITDKVEGSTDDADVVATDTWISMGDESEKEKRVKEFHGYMIDEKLMGRANKNAIFMHCLPAYYGYEVTKGVAHGKQSVIFDEAENRLWAQIAIMVTLCK
jgi:ornithine carbamoyltransferase